MLGNFSYYNPTKLYFGDESLNFLKDELKGYGPVVLLNYGSGSVKRNGIYDQVIAIMKEAGKTIVENPGVMTNPTLEKLNEGVKIARENEVDLILALGGLEALKDWMLEIGLPLTISELGATADMIPGITETTVVYPAGYLDLTKEDITEILKESM
jgi:alcohol dehydrogenase YqhD (iron-dependent ADH family)